MVVFVILLSSLGGVNLVFQECFLPLECRLRRDAFMEVDSTPHLSTSPPYLQPLSTLSQRGKKYHTLDQIFCLHFPYWPALAAVDCPGQPRPRLNCPAGAGVSPRSVVAPPVEMSLNKSSSSRHPEALHRGWLTYDATNSLPSPRRW